MKVEPAPWEANIRRMLRRVSGEVTAAAHIDDVFWQVQAIIAANRDINTLDIFQEWIGDVYVDSVVIRIRRLVDKDRNTISLWRLLDLVKAEHVRFTRSRFVALWPSDLRGMANDRFDTLAGPGGKFVHAEVIATKQQELARTLGRVKSFANANVAHRNENPGQPSARFLDLRESLIAAFEVFNWCASLIEATPWASAVPAIQSNWTAVFREAWLPAGAPVPAYRHLDDLRKAFREKPQA